MEQDLFKVLEEIEKEDKKENKIIAGELLTRLPNGQLAPASKADRVRLCGGLRHKIDPKTGMLIGYYQRCGLHEYCDICLKHRASEEQTAFVGALDGNKKVYKLVVNGSNQDKLKSIPTSDYRRFPQDDETTIVLHTNDEIGGEEVNPYKLDWQEMTNTPKGKNISGKLCLSLSNLKSNNGDDKDKKDEDVEKVCISQESIIPENDDKDDKEQRIDFQEAFEEAVLETIDLEPVLDTLKDAMKKRMKAYKTALTERGYEIRFFVYEFCWVREDEIDWKSYNDSIREKYSNPDERPIIAQFPVRQPMEYDPF